MRILYDRSTERVAHLLAAKMETLPRFLRDSLAWDQGKELPSHEKFTVRSGMPVYFCDPQCRGSGGPTRTPTVSFASIFRRDRPVGYSQADLDAVAAEFNDRSRQTLGWKSPRFKLDELLIGAGDASTT